MSKGKGLEVGGPSPIFMRTGEMSIYNKATQLDCVCFSKDTVWNKANPEYAPEGVVLGKFIEAEAIDLTCINHLTYDYLLSSHQLEHSANPIQCLFEFKRVLKIGGELLVIVPDQKFTFDHCRPYTPLSHLLEDYQNKVKEDDLTHFGEIMYLHDLKRDPGAPQSIEGFALRSLQNYHNRCLHHHVFSVANMIHMLEFVDFRDIKYQSIGIHLIFTARKL